MDNMQKYHFYIWILLSSTIASCFGDHKEEDNFFFNSLEQPNLINPHSLNYDRTSKKMLNSKEFGVTPDPINPNLLNIDTKMSDKLLSKDDNIQQQDALFYIRLVKLLLENLQVKSKTNNEIMGIVTFRLTERQMKFVKNVNANEVPLREIDAIMSEVIRKPEFDFMFEVANGFDILSNKMQFLFTILQNNVYVITLGCTMLLFVFIMSKHNTLRALPIGLMLIFVSSWFITWWQLIKEAEIKLTAQQMMYSAIPNACQPDKMNIWEKFVATLSNTNDCEKYYEAMMGNANLKVTPALALSHLVSTVILHPVSHLGHALSEFVESATGQTSYVYGWLIRITLYTAIPVLLCIAILCLSGVSIHLGLGPLLNFGINVRGQSQTNQKRLKHDNQREAITIIREIHHISSAPALSNSSDQKSNVEISNATDPENVKPINSLPAVVNKKDENLLAIESKDCTEEEFFDSSDSNKPSEDKESQLKNNTDGLGAGDS